jgi:hypothetical protein
MKEASLILPPTAGVCPEFVCVIDVFFWKKCSSSHYYNAITCRMIWKLCLTILLVSMKKSWKDNARIFCTLIVGHWYVSCIVIPADSKQWEELIKITRKHWLMISKWKIWAQIHDSSWFHISLPVSRSEKIVDRLDLPSLMITFQHGSWIDAIYEGIFRICNSCTPQRLHSVKFSPMAASGNNHLWNFYL